MLKNKEKDNQNDGNLFEIYKNVNWNLNNFPLKYLNSISEESLEIVRMAEEGDINKQFEVGRNLIEGRYDFPIDVEIGISFLRNSIDKGNKDSLIYYINMLIKGKVIHKYHKKALKLINKHFLEDDFTHSFLMGKLLKNEKRYQEAAECFKQSMKFNDSDSIYEYAELINKGYLESINPESSIKYYQKAIEMGNLRALYKQGIHLYENEQNEDHEKGIKMIKEAADKGNLKAMYYYSENIINEELRSLQYFKHAADEGHGKSMNKYGTNLLYFLRNSPKEQNKDEAIRYIKKAMKKGFIESIYNYGVILVYGEDGIPSNEKEGSRYVKIAALSGYPDAMGKYATLLKIGEGVEQDAEEAK